MDGWKPAAGGICHLLREARERAGLTQTALAAQSGIAQPNISAYENGARSPTVRTLLAILEACDAELMLTPSTSAAVRGHRHPAP